MNKDSMVEFLLCLNVSTTPEAYGGIVHDAAERGPLHSPPPDLSTLICFFSTSFSCCASSISAILAKREYATWPDLIADIICASET